MTTPAPLNLPQSVLDLQEFAPVEDVVLAILRQGLPDIEVVSLIADHATFPFLLVRGIPGFEQSGDPRFVNAVKFQVDSFTQDPDADEKGAKLQEAVRVVVRNAWLKNLTLPGLGSVSYTKLTYGPARGTDWAASVGPVQYADLPTGVQRYEAQYDIEIARPR